MKSKIVYPCNEFNRSNLGLAHDTFDYCAHEK
jgi:hypothetical protein